MSTETAESAVRVESREVSGRPRSLWMQAALGCEAERSPVVLAGHHDVDVCIVGGGFTGLWTALRLKEHVPSLEVGVLEADICGSGASGANGGFAMTWWPKTTTLAKVMSTDDAVRMARASQEAVADIGRFCEQHGIAADFRPEGWLWAATNPSQLDSWRATLDDLARLGETPFRELDADRVAELSGSRQHLGGVFEDGVATVQPAALARGLRTVALAAGVRVWEHSPMTRLDRNTDRVVAHTPQGRVRASRMVLATNAWLAGYREIRRHLLVLGSDIVATQAVPELLSGSAFGTGLAISDSRRLVHYYRATEDGRVVFGKGGGRLSFHGRLDPERWARSTRDEAVRAQLVRTYPALAGARITHAWSGAVDYSCDSLPFFGRLKGDERIVYAVGFSGNGVGPSHLAGRVLASMALGLDDEWGASPLVRTPKTYLPPEPFRYVGGLAVRSALLRKEAAEDRGRRPSRLSEAIAGLDPTSFVG